MIIKIGTTILAGEKPTEQPDGLQINGRRLGQEGNFLRAVQARMFDRGNVKMTVAFSVHRQHADILTAQYFVVKHAADLPGSGTVDISAESEAGAEAHLYLENALLTITGHQQRGVSTIHAYTIEGGLVTAANPD